MSQVQRSLPQLRAFGETKRKDRWWVQPLLVFLGLSAFIVYGTWAAFQGAHYVFQGGGADYLSPFYSPVLFEAKNVSEWLAGGAAATGHAWISNAPPAWWPGWAPIAFSPAFLILWAPGGFRFTCYYYRGAYYKAFWQDPTSCAVGEPGIRGKKYRGERKLPLILQNVHRYFLYLAIVFVGILSYDAWRGFWFTTSASGEPLPEGTKQFGVAVGSLVLLLNPILLAGYTFGCHSLRHLIGGVRDRLAGRPAQKKAYDCVSCLNRRHMQWAWVSLFWVAFADVYVRLASHGVIPDFRLL